MGGKYSTTGNENAVTAAYTSALSIQAEATFRSQVYDVTMSQDGAVGDQMLTWTLNRFTVAPTDTAVVPVALDEGEPAAVSVTGENASAEGTQTAATEFFEIGVHMRQTVRFYFNEAERILLPANATDGVSLRVKAAAYTGAAKGGIHFQE